MRAYYENIGLLHEIYGSHKSHRNSKNRNINLELKTSAQRLILSIHLDSRFVSPLPPRKLKDKLKNTTISIKW